MNTLSPFENPLAGRSLTKRWFVLRHGRSEANEKGIVASQLANAENAFGLIDSGRAEVEISVREAASQLHEHAPLRIFMSPFLRTCETAAIAGEILGVTPEVDGRLRERDFGEFELLSDDHYEQVWKVDPVDPTRLPGGAETVYEVAGRTSDLILEAESDPDFSTGLLVTHCDVAMILSSVFQELDPRHHRSLDPIKTGEIRLFNKSVQS